MRDTTDPLFHWYVDSAHGKELVLALYTAPCAYAMCTFCSLPSLAEGGHRVTAADVEAQVDRVMSAYADEQLDQVAKVSVYTAASVLDQRCLPTRSLMYLVLRTSRLPALSVFSLETRTEYVEDWELKALRAVLTPGVTLEVAIGYETHDPHLRNRVLRKGLTERGLRQLFSKLADNGCRLKAYLLLKPHHSLSEQGGIDEAVAGLDHLAGLGREFDVGVSIHLNPTYVAEGCKLADEMRENHYEPPELSSVLTVVRAAIERGLPTYVGLDDEGLATDGGTYRSTGCVRARAVAALLAFNRHQDLARLDAEFAP